MDVAGKHDGRVTLSTKLDTSGIQSGAKGIKSALTASCKAVAALGAAAATAIVAVTKQSVDAYAAYEQLAGGVETLFKQSADKVKAYAADAYKTAGVSANAYMEAVTSFSASLISSLGGNTEKAAEVANMAMVDMSDNANKLGTPLANIQTAYQGFAKQNYTMLDNLKLGYGGTKTEMERLLKDAEAFSGVKYDINNLSDVYQAIHQIQVKLGVAGTTAKEAESTISGSAAMTKSAWENVLAAMSGGGDLDKAIADLVYSLEKYMQNIVPVVERSLVGIGYAIERLAPMLVERIAIALIKAIPSLLNAVYKMVIGLAQGVYQGIKALFTGGTTEVLEEQAEQIGASVENQEALTEAVKETEKAAKKALAGFDELNILAHDSAAAVSDTISAPSNSTGAISGIGPEITTVESTAGPLDQLFSNLLVKLEPLKTAIDSLVTACQPLATNIGEGLAWLYENVLVPLADWALTQLIPSALDLISAAVTALDAVWVAIEPTFLWIWENMLVPLRDFLWQVIIDFIDGLTSVFTAFSDWARDNRDTLEDIATVVIGFLAGLWVYNTSKKVIDFVKNLGKAIATMGDKLSLAGLKGAFFAAAIGILVAGVLVLAKNWDKLSPAERVITILGALAAAATAAAIAIAVFHTSWSVGLAAAAIVGGLALLGLTFAFTDTGDTGDAAKTAADNFYSSYDWNKEFTLPALAKGAVLPANKPFLAMVGDQRHGTNIEAPLSTIQEAVATVMADYEAANLAGHEATVAALREILAAVLGIEIGDTTIGQAANRHNQKMAIIKGGL